MDIKLHKQATTTPKVRAEIQAASPSISDSELARQYGVSDSTIRGITGGQVGPTDGDHFRALDSDGRPTTDAQAAEQGVVLPFGGPKPS